MQRNILPVLACVLLVFLFLPTEGANQRVPDVALSKTDLTDFGRRVFFQETFRGNGRTCSTCHQPRNSYTITPELIQARFQEDPDDPLFRPVDSDEGMGKSFSILLEHAIFRVEIPLHRNVRLADERLQRTIAVRRSVPAIANVLFTGPFLFDGRAPDLPSQALGALAAHFGPVRQPTLRELRALQRFQESLFVPQSVASLAEEDDPVPKQPGFSLSLTGNAALRGQETFQLHCATCHSGELANLPDSPAGDRFQTAFVSERNRPAFPLLTLVFTLPGGGELAVKTPDPGLAAITGRIQDLNKFKTPQLRGIKHTAPYFHDNSAETLDVVIDHYIDTFGFQILSEKKDLLAFLGQL